MDWLVSHRHRGDGRAERVISSSVPNSALLTLHLHGMHRPALPLHQSESSLDRLSRVDLSGRNLDGVRAKRIRLVGADLRSADLRDADLRGANLTGARLDGATLTDGDHSTRNRTGVAAGQDDASRAVEESTEHYWERLMKSLAQRARPHEGDD